MSVVEVFGQVLRLKMQDSHYCGFEPSHVRGEYREYILEDTTLEARLVIVDKYFYRARLKGENALLQKLYLDGASNRE